MDSYNDTLLNMLDDGSCEEDLLGSMTDLKDKEQREKVKQLKTRDDDDANSMESLNESLNESLSLDDESTVLEGKKLVSELHRIKGLLGNVLERKNTPNTPDGAGGVYGGMVKSPDGITPVKRNQIPTSPSSNKKEVERLKAQLH